MNNAIGFVLTNFAWFGDLVLSPFANGLKLDRPFGLLAALGAFGALTFGAGLVLSELRKNRRPYLLLLTVLLAVVMVALSSAFRGQVRGPILAAIVWGTLGLQAAIALVTLYWARGGRLATALMMPLCVSFCLWSQLDAAMSFSDSWL